MATFTELVEQLREIEAEIAAVDPNDIHVFDLRILALQVERKINVSGFDPLMELPSVTVPDMTRLRELAVELKQAIQDEQKRTALLGKIFGIAKKIAGVAGIPGAGLL